METSPFAVLALVRDGLAVLGIAFGLSQCFAGWQLYDKIRRLPGALGGLVLAGLIAWLLRGEPLPTIVAAALGASAGWWVIGTWDDLILRASAAAIGALVGAGLAALLVLVLQVSLAPSTLLLLVLAPAIIAAALAVRWRDLIIILATSVGGAALVVGGAA